LEPEREQLKPGEEMDVRVMFYNPRRSDLDSIRLLIDFDPKMLEVLDTDEGNAIASGVNIREGNRRAFPFDYFVENRVDNHRGSIEFRMGMAGTRSVSRCPSGRDGQVRGRRDTAGLTILRICRRLPRRRRHAFLRARCSARARPHR
jgi:hypothetical protein